ncbi:hypothetical protein [Klebsiella phage UPM 2146]|uniref:Uncharacterized protein n=1 Tax=Klebsiella phage UPM 2146 TaxID=2847816 RepID=A0A5Q2F2S1_9CAUD|nr:hypothetical protein HYQ02_gp214 [Klebsiella phage UPM 2146]QGF20645.1 hypothetical protein [Klebsiella phage UPM 2146]
MYKMGVTPHRKRCPNYQKWFGAKPVKFQEIKPEGTGAS